MKVASKLLMVGLAWALLGAFVPARATAADFTVTAPDMAAYVINSASNPTLTLVRGKTYSFAISASGHPFFIKTAAITGTGSTFDSGVTGNGTSVGTLTFTVPASAPNTLFYACQFHAAMAGTINVTSPAVPAVGRTALGLAAVALLLAGATLIRRPWRNARPAVVIDGSICGS